MKIKVEKMDNMARGIGYIDGKIAFIDNSLAGEVIEAEKIYENKKYIVFKNMSIIDKSPLRIEPVCKYYSVCGGCDLMHLNYTHQLEYKTKKIKDLVYKYLKDDIPVCDIVSSLNFNYRNKVSFKVNRKLCYVKKKSNELINVDKCYLLDERINEMIDVLNKNVLDKIEEVIIRCGKKDVMIILKGIWDNKLIENLKEYVSSIYFNDELVFGDKYIENVIGDYKFVISPNSFFQVNDYQVKKLYDKVVEYADLNGEEIVLDLYCGTGTIGVYLSKYAKEVIGVEVNKDAIKDANINKKINNVENISFICDTTSNINEIVSKKIDLVIVDPPRSGLDKNTINYILKNNIKRVVYVSCDPMTLMRDLNILKNAYDIKEITPFDMFPNTYHVECVCSLNLRKVCNDILENEIS